MILQVITLIDPAKQKVVGSVALTEAGVRCVEDARSAFGTRVLIWSIQKKERIETQPLLHGKPMVP
jgi:hypothetical protein